jgi:general secretion pathway protein G
MSFLADSPITATLLAAALASLAYLAIRFRGGRRHFTTIDALLLAMLMAVASAIASPWLHAAGRGTKDLAIQRNLGALRSQIELYKLEHNGDPPVLYQGGFPQLLQATNGEGVIGPAGSDHPYGPYLPKGVLMNTATGRSTVTLTEVFPPTGTSGIGGWLYHQPTGQIAIDLPEMLNW